jgi:hypothetical protein
MTRMYLGDFTIPSRTSTFSVVKSTPGTKSIFYIPVSRIKRFALPLAIEER